MIANESLPIAIGGTRVAQYANEQEALVDCLELAQTMQLKNDLIQSGLSGAKACLFPANKDKAWIHAYAKALNDLPHCFYTGVDFGFSEEDVLHLSKLSSKIVGLHSKPALATARLLSLFLVMIKQTFNFKECKIGIQGLGKVGMELFQQLQHENVNFFLSDINPKVFETIQDVYPIKENLLNESLDIFSPCAIGPVINDQNIRLLKCKVICGSANYQLAYPELSEKLEKQNILYIPDYLANCGGLIAAVSELVYKQDFSNHLDDKFKEMCQLFAKYLAMKKDILN